jgi:hypothetical protein
MPAVEDISLNFTPVPSLAKMFLATTANKFVFVFGPVGSTKTTSCLMWLMMRAARQAPSPDGIRRTRFALVRNTLVALKQTVLKDILSLFAGMVEWRPSENVCRIKVADIDTEWILMGLESPEDQKRLLSLQLSGVYINEVREILYQLIFAAFSRTGRFPNMKHGGVTCSYRFLLADSNMGVDGSPLHHFLEVEKHPAVMYIHQPSALSSAADWLQYLPEGYYRDAQVGQTRAWIDTHIHAKWSADLSGEPIFAAVFNEFFHVSPTPLQTVPGLPILGGVDPGLNPACILGQLTASGQLRVYKELFAENQLFGDFVDSQIIPTSQLPGFAGRAHFFTMDPSGVNRHAISGLSAKGFMDSRGFQCVTAATNDIDPRLKAIENYLTKIISPGGDFMLSLVDIKRKGPQPGLLIDPSCEKLIEALNGKYRYKRNRAGELEAKPEKKHPISDVVDGLGYLAMGINTAPFKKLVSSIGAPRPTQLTVDRRGWT